MTKTKKSYRIGLYIRVSTEEQAENPEGSIRNQEERLRQTVKLKNMEGHFGEIIEVYLDCARSGKDTKRPALQRMLQAIRNREINLVMATELSRVSRSIRDFAEIWEMMQANDCGFQSLRENFDTTTAAGEMVLYTMANIAQFERRQVSERVAANFQSRASRGLYNGGCIPYGYRRMPEKPGYLEINPDEAENVRTVFKVYLETQSTAKAAKVLNAKGIRLTRAMQGGGRQRLGHFIFDTVHKILKNKAYIGVRTYLVKGETHETKAVWEPIVDRIIFDRVQKIVTRKVGRPKAASETRYPYLLSGLLFCKQCGDRLSGRSAHGRNGKIAYYEHAWCLKAQAHLKNKTAPCDHPRMLARLIEPIVWDETRRFLTQPQMLKELMKETKVLQSKNQKGSELESLKYKIHSLNSQLEALTDRLSQLPKSVSATPIFKQMEKFEETKAIYQSRLELAKAQSGQQDLPVATDDLNEFKKSIMQLLKLQDDPEIRTKLIAKVVHRVDVTKDGVEIQFHIGSSHYSQELALMGSSRSLIPKSEEKREATPPQPKFFSEKGSRSLQNGGGAGSRTRVRKSFVLRRATCLVVALRMMHKRPTTNSCAPLPQLF